MDFRIFSRITQMINLLNRLIASTLDEHLLSISPLYIYACAYTITHANHFRRCHLVLAGQACFPGSEQTISQIVFSPYLLYGTIKYGSSRCVLPQLPHFITRNRKMRTRSMSRTFLIQLPCTINLPRQQGQQSLGALIWNTPCSTYISKVSFIR